MTTQENLKQEKSNETVRKIEKHPFNIFPEMTDEENNEVRLDIEKHGYDTRYPIILYQNKILDGWNRQHICEDLCVMPTYEEFDGNDLEAMEFIWRSNKRRNLTSSQRAAIAAEAQPIMELIEEAVKKEKAEKLQGNRNAVNDKQLVEKIPPTGKQKRDDSRRSSVKLARQFNTNTKYVEKAKELKKCKPEILMQIKKGEVSINDVMRAERNESIAIQKNKEQKLLASTVETNSKAPEPSSSVPKKVENQLVLDVSLDLFIKLKAYAKTQNAETNLLKSNPDHIKTAIALLMLSVEHPPFENDIRAMKNFKAEIVRLYEEFGLAEGTCEDKIEVSRTTQL